MEGPFHWELTVNRGGFYPESCRCLGKGFKKVICLGERFEEDWWAGALDRICSSTICAHLGLIQFKILKFIFSRSSYLKYFLIFKTDVMLLRISKKHTTQIALWCKTWINFTTTVSVKKLELKL